MEHDDPDRLAINLDHQRRLLHGVWHSVQRLDARSGRQLG